VSTLQNADEAAADAAASHGEGGEVLLLPLTAVFPPGPHLRQAAGEALANRLLVCKYTGTLADMRITHSRRLQAGSTSRQVYSALREAIIAGELEPGQRLSENELSERFGVSRTPIREALALLRDERFVQVVPQLGTFVTRISDAAVADAQFVREALECAAVRVAAERVQPGDIAALEGLLRRQEEVVAQNDHERFAVLDDEFHAAICELSGSGVAWEVAQRVKGHLSRVRRLSLPHPNYLRTMLVEHHDVLDALRRASPDDAESALRHHLRMVLSAVPALRAQQPDYFEDEERPAS
jgi:DNA-binding GntR family transcriptional regulator